ncbi:MAG: hypothetical protein H6Q73_1477 [Firmicutes bacterium]|nr:hypothetical protein [Bacillota bacterium]
MSVDFRKLGFTRRTWVLLAILVIMAVGYFYSRIADPTPMVPMVVVSPGGKGSGEVQPLPVSLERVPPVVAARDPFLIPASFRQHEQTVVAEPVGARASDVPAVKADKAPVMKAPMLPIIKGTVVGSTASAAILTLGSQTRSVLVGEEIGEYRLVAVDSGYAVLAGPGGLITLGMRR